MYVTEQNLEYVLESVIEALQNEEIEIDEELLDECFDEVLSEISASKLGRYISASKKDEDKRRDDGRRWRDQIRKETGLKVGVPIDRKLYSPEHSREAGRKRAISKLTGSAKVNAS